MERTKLQKEYDELAESYELNRGLFDMTPVLTALWDELSYPSGELLDLGCGAGEPVAQWFLERGWHVTGVDFSANMLKLAERFTPGMKVIYSDMREVSLGKNQYDAITAVYSFFHLPVDDQFMMFSRIRQWLKPGGKFLFTYATRDYTGKEEFSGYIEFMGKQLYYSHTTLEKLRSQLENTGFVILSEDYREIGGEVFLWITAARSEQAES